MKKKISDIYDTVWRITVIVFFLGTIIWATSSCSTSKVVSSDVTTATHTTNVAVSTSDSITHNETHTDSVCTQTVQRDSVIQQQYVTDSTVINNTVETVITNTVDVDGNILGTNRETTRTISRDHWRNTDNNTKATSDKDVSVKEKVTDDVQDIVKHEHDSLIAIIDSLQQVSNKVVEKDTRSWYQRLTDSIGGFIFSLFLGVLCVIAAYLGVKYWFAK